MFTIKDFDVIRELSGAAGLSGREKPVADLISSILRSIGWEVFQDRLNTVSILKEGSGPHIMFVAHLDEIGMIVRRITDEGFILVHRVGGINPISVSGRMFDLWADSGRISAFAGILPPHLQKSSKLPDIQDIYLDIGASSKEEAEQMGIQVGDGITSRPNFEICGTKVFGKGLDDRLGCFILIKLAEFLKDLKTDYTISLVFTSFEETMLQELGPVIRRLNPEMVIGVDGTLTFDTPDIQNKQCDITLGKGFCIKWMDTIPGKATYYPDWELSKRLATFAKVNGFIFQSETVSGICNALSPVAFMNRGIVTASLSIPIRYHHSDFEMADLKDVKSLFNFLSKTIEAKIYV